MASISHKLSNSLEGALAGGGDPATSPLYVFGPFLRLIVVAGVAKITFGASIWLAVLTIAVVSAMYRLVMQWVTDGSGGSGLSEEEFGGWAVKVNAAITFIEYTLTFLVSMAAMVTFIADRVPFLNQNVLGLSFLRYRMIIAIGLSILTGWLVNRGPKMAARTFGPATAGVLILLWLMIISSIWNEKGIVLPKIDPRAFTEELHFTIGGFVRILAVMTGIEVFANLVAAYEGTAKEKSRKAFNSLLIIMGTTAITMLIVGPSIYKLADPTNEEISVFTQTMDLLLPSALAYAGTLVGIAVLMSASAASAQGLQNLALGLRRRHYIPPTLGQRNKFGVADKPVWIEVGIVCVCFLFLGTREETYLAIYAAGVFILLSMTGWAVTKRLLREIRQVFSPTKFLLILGTVLAAIMTTGAAILIFSERFFEGAWTYIILIPALFILFSFSRSRLGEPTPEMDYLGQLDAAQLAGFGFGQIPQPVKSPLRSVIEVKPIEYTWLPAPIEHSKWRNQKIEFHHLVVLLDGSQYAAQAIPIAKEICRKTGAQMSLLSSSSNEEVGSSEQKEEQTHKIEDYLKQTCLDLTKDGIKVDYFILDGSTADITTNFVIKYGVDLVVTTTRGKSGQHHWLSGGLSKKLIQRIDIPVLLVQTTETQQPVIPVIKRILVSLDGSIYSENSLPYARALSKAFNSELILLTVPEVPQVEDYRAPSDIVDSIRSKAEVSMCKFLSAVARSLHEEGIEVKPLVTGSIPTSTITAVSQDENVDLIVITSQGRGGFDLLMMGSVAQRVIQNSNLPVLMIPIHHRL
jgi:nucleotide-binding universal stress UspA family protein